MALAGNGYIGEVIVPATNRRGKGIACKVTATPLHDGAKGTEGVILVMDEQPAG